MKWSVVHEIKDHGAGVCVSISATDHSVPLYSLAISKMSSDISYRFFPLRMRGLGKVELSEPSVGPVIARLVREAESWCLEKAQAKEDEIIAEKEARERADLDRGKPKPLAGTHSKGRKA